MSGSNSMKAKIALLTISGLIAAAAALLYAPNSGAETRQRLSAQRDQALEKTRQFLQETQQSANQLVKRNARLALDEASAILDQGKEQLTTTRQKLAEDEAAA
jgi:gas vesicle protein